MGFCRREASIKFGFARKHGCNIATKKRKQNVWLPVYAYAFATCPRTPPKSGFDKKNLIFCIYMQNECKICYNGYLRMIVDFKGSHGRGPKRRRQGESEWKCGRVGESNQIICLTEHKFSLEPGAFSFSLASHSMVQQFPTGQSQRLSGASAPQWKMIFSQMPNFRIRPENKEVGR